MNGRQKRKHWQMEVTKRLPVRFRLLNLVPTADTEATGVVSLSAVAAMLNNVWIARL